MANLTISSNKVATLTIETTTSNLSFEVKKTNLVLSKAGAKGQTGTSEWGVITGDISNQTDLQSELDAKTNYDDDYIIYLAEKSTVTDGGFSYTSGKLTGIAYDNTATITSNSKVLSYTGDLLTTIVHTFTYNSQVWTITTSYTYTGDLLTGKPTRTINKI